MWIEREDGKEMVGIKRGGDMIYRQDAIDAVEHTKSAKSPDGEVYVAKINAEMNIQLLPPAHPTLYGYNIEHLDLIARVLQRENLPPERIAEMLTDIGRIVAIVSDEFEESLRKAVERGQVNLTQSGD